MTGVWHLFLALLVIGLALVGYALIEAQLFTVRRVEVPVLPAGSEPIRILHISDLHLTPGQSRKIRWLRSLDRFRTDLVIATGDFLAHPLGVSAVAEALDLLFDQPGVFVFGSNDYHGPVLKNPFLYLKNTREIGEEGEDLPTPDLRELLTDAGWIDLNNAQVRLEVGGTKVHFKGTDDFHTGRARYDSVKGAFDHDAVAIGVTHSPYAQVLNAFAHDGAALVFAGHTHGGQVCIPGRGALVTNCDLPTSQAKGLSTVVNQETLLHVSAGVGTSPVTPIRFACRPEVTIVTLVGK